MGRFEVGLESRRTFGGDDTPSTIWFGDASRFASLSALSENNAQRSATYGAYLSLGGDGRQTVAAILLGGVATSCIRIKLGSGESVVMFGDGGATKHRFSSTIYDASFLTVTHFRLSSGKIPPTKKNSQQ